MVQSCQLQAEHCRGLPARQGVRRDRLGRSWYVEACREHALTDLTILLRISPTILDSNT
jgi:hypothetical protein